MDLTIACVWVGERYGAEYPATLQDMVRRHLSAAHTPRFVCITDRPHELPDGIEAIEPEPGLPGWWQKVALFKPGKIPGQRIVYFDLDVAITGMLDALVERPGIIQDWHLPTCNSSVMVWDAGDHSDAWERFTRADMDRLRGDQDWLTEIGGWDLLPDGWCASYRSNAMLWPPAEASVVVFHGEPKPHECDGWVRLVWRRGGLQAIPKGSVNVSHERLYANIRSAVARGLPVFTGQLPHSRDCCIVGSGPSVKRYLEDIRRRQAEGAVVASLNGSLRWLLEHGITPSSHVLLDARRENVEFVQDVPHETTVLVASQCDPAVFDALAEHPNVILWHADLNGDEEQLEIVAPKDGDRVLLVGGGSTVGLRAMYLAYFSGFRQLHLYGFDSCYTADGEHHAFPQPLNNGERIFEVMMAGHTYLCSGWMANQAQQFNAHHHAIGGHIPVAAHGEGLIPDICRIRNEEMAKRSRGVMAQRTAPILARLPAGPCEMAEIGVSQAVLGSHLLREHCDLTWHGVDSWLGQEMQPEAYLATNDAHAQMSQGDADWNRHAAIVRLRPFGGRARVYHMPSRAAAGQTPDASLDLVFLDADHSFEGLTDDIAAWWSKVKPGGWIGGHDYNNPDQRYRFGVERAVHEWADREGLPVHLDAGLTWWTQKETA